MRNTILFFGAMCLQLGAFAQQSSSFYYISDKEDFSINVNGRMQTRFSARFFEDSPATAEISQPRMELYRSRLSFSGMLMENTFKYNFQFGFSQEGDTAWNFSKLLYDAEATWRIRDNIHLKFGQFIMPGNLGRMVTSEYFQFVDRSVLSGAYSLDRDVGLQLNWRHYLGSFVVREKLVLTSGEGRNSEMNLGGFNYGFRLEVLPFGEFTGGEYFEADLAIDDRPKLMLGLGYNHNDNSRYSGGQKGGTLLSAERDIKTFSTDLHYKASAWSVLFEYMNVAVDIPVVYDKSAGLIVGNSFIAGDGLNAQVGYKIKGQWEVAGRFSRLAPLEVTQLGSFNEYTAALNYYIEMHRIKWQLDFSMRQADDELTKDLFVVRTQLQLGF